MKNILGLTIFLLFFVSCSTTKSSLKKANDFQKNLNTKIYLNNNQEQPINLDSVYLDRKNISEIKFDKQSNALFIFQKNKDVKLLNLSDINLENLSSRNKIKSIILNGILLSENDIKNIKLEETVIKDFRILINNNLHKGSSLRENEEKSLVITTKK